VHQIFHTGSHLVEGWVNRLKAGAGDS